MHQMINSNGRQSVMELVTTFNAAKILLSIVSISSFEPLSNRFKHKANRVVYTKNEFLHFTNISMFYTILCVCAGFVKGWSPAFEQLYKFLLPTSIVLEMMVTLLFWSLFLINPSLVKCSSPGSGLSVFSYSSEAPKHLFPLIILMMEQNGMDLCSAWEHRAFLILFSITYFIIVEALIVYESNYLYPFLKHLTAKWRVVFFVFTTAASIALYEAWVRLKATFGAKKVRHQEQPIFGCCLRDALEDLSQNLQFESDSTVSHEKTEVPRAEALKESKLSGVEKN